MKQTPNARQSHLQLCENTANRSFITANKTAVWRLRFRGGETVVFVLRLTFLTVVKLVKLTGFGLALAEDQVMSDVTIRVIGRFPLQDDLGGRVGRRNGVQRDRRFWKDNVEVSNKCVLVLFKLIHSCSIKQSNKNSFSAFYCSNWNFFFCFNKLATFPLVLKQLFIYLLVCVCVNRRTGLCVNALHYQV